MLGLKALFWCVAVLLPVTASWIASSMAAYANGPVWLVALTAFALFPVLPLVWEGVASHRRSRRKVAGPRILTFGDRLLLRTLALSLVFVVGLLAVAPESGVRAIAARGDWMLDGSTSDGAARARAALFRIADAFEWIYEAAREDGVEEGEDGRRPDKDDRAPEPLPDAESISNGEDGKTDGEQKPPEPPPAMPRAGQSLWPSSETLHPLVSSIPADDEASIVALGAYLAKHEPDEALRIKAVHDWIADRIRYDMTAFRTNVFPSQQADAVFEERLGVCAGYSNLFVALSNAASLDAVVVVGVAKGAGGEVDGRGHAWNAVRVGGQWQLVDVTWNAGGVGSDGEWRKRYESDYLFVPPDVMLHNHLPDEDKWQLVDVPISRGDFMRRPQVGPAFFAQGFKLTSPSRSQTTVGRKGEIVVENPSGRFMLASYTPKSGGSERDRCEVQPGPTIRIVCDFESEGEYRVLLFSSPVRYGTYHSVGELEMLSTGR